MAGGEHEAVAVRPVRRGRIELEVAREKDGRDIGGTHGKPGMAGLGALDGVHAERADRVRHALVLLEIDHFEDLCPEPGCASERKTQVHPARSDDGQVAVGLTGPGEPVDT